MKIETRFALFALGFLASSWERGTKFDEFDMMFEWRSREPSSKALRQKYIALGKLYASKKC